MKHILFSYKGYDMRVANLQPSKKRRGGVVRSLKICARLPTGYLIKHSIRYDSTEKNAFSKASQEARDWIDQQNIGV